MGWDYLEENPYQKKEDDGEVFEIEDLEEKTPQEKGYTDGDHKDSAGLSDHGSDGSGQNPENMFSNDEDSGNDSDPLLTSLKDLDSSMDDLDISTDNFLSGNHEIVHESEEETIKNFVSGAASYEDEKIEEFEDLGKDFDFDLGESSLLNEASSENAYTEATEVFGGTDQDSIYSGFDKSVDSIGGLGVGSSGRDVYTASSLRNFYDDMASGDDVSVGSFDSPSAMFGRFVDNISEDRAELVSEVLGAWVNWPTNKSTAPLWHIFAEANDNFKVPIEFEEEGIDAEAFGEALHSFSDFTEEVFRERFGESVVLYRSIDEQGLAQMEEDAPETDSIVLDHRPVESWTFDPEFAEDWKNGYVLRREINVEEVIASHVTHPSFISREKEVLVESDGKEKYSEDEVVHTSRFDKQENAEWALSKLGDPEKIPEKVSGPEWMDLDNAVGSRSLRESGAITANKSSQFMYVAEYENGREAFVTELSSSEYQDETGADPVEAERALAGEQFFENIGLGKYIPSHFVDLEEGYMAVESVDGYEIDKAPEEARNQVNTDEYLKFAAATILSGNSDMDGRNTMVDEEGHIYGIDIDHAGGDFTEGGRHYRRGMKDLKMNADELGLEIDYSDIKEATEIVADQIDPFEATEGIESSQVSNKDMYNFRQNIMNNITSFAEGRFPGEFGYNTGTAVEYEEEVARV